LWKAGNEAVHLKIDGYTGQRTGSLGFPNTYIEIMGPASDDVGWLNAGAQIIVHCGRWGQWEIISANSWQEALL
jgi:glutamate synthase domain-containing protein 3